MITSDKYIRENGKKIDVLKLALAILVVGIHTTKVGFVLRPIFRISVPTFFIISAYLFFCKQTTLTSLVERKQALMKYVKRILILYLFWFVALFPLTAHYRQWFDDFSLHSLLEIIKGFFFGSTFMASWFLMASVIGVIIVWYLREKNVRNVWLLIGGVVIYCLCCLTSTYDSLCMRIPGFENAYQSYYSIFRAPFTSFPCALLFVAIGKILAERKLYIPDNLLLSVMVLSLVALYCEYWFTSSCFKVVNDDCYFSLPILCTCLFMMVGQSSPIGSHYDTKRLRAYSIIIYCSHVTVATFLYKNFGNIFAFPRIPLCLTLFFVTTLAIALLLSWAILKLERYKPLKWLRFAH